MSFGITTYLSLGVTLLVALLGSRVSGAWVEQSFRGKQQRRERNYADASRGLKQLSALRVDVLKYGAASEEDPVDPNRDEVLAQKANDLLIAVARSGDRSAIELAEGYELISQLYATGAEETTASDEVEAYYKLLRALAEITRSAK